jgi:GPH family glycoside/pentoside/hexuronide:cation symporter
MISNKNLIAYSLPAFCLAFIGMPIYIYLPNFYANNYGMDLQLIGIILLITRLVDTAQDPVIGIFSDRFSAHKRKIILGFAPLLGAAFFFLFNPIENISLSLWLVVLLIVTYSFYSVVYINYASYAVGLSDDYHFKTKIIAYREYSFIGGILCAAILPFFLANIFGEKQAFSLIGAAYFFLISFFAIIFYKNTKDLKIEKQQNSTFKSLLKIKDLRSFFAIFLLNAITSAIPASLILFYVEEVLKLKEQTGLFLVLYFSGMLFGVYFWSKLSKILNDKIKAWIFAMILTVVSFSWCYFLGEGDLLFYAIICFISGFAFGGDFCLGFSILTDLIQKYNLRAKETTIFSICNFLIKLSLTLASASLVYGLGYIQKNNSGFETEFLSFSYSVLPVLFKLLTIFLLINYAKNFKTNY